MRTKKMYVCSIFVSFIMAYCSLASAQSNETTKANEVLRDLKTVRILVDNSPLAEQEGLTAARLRASIEQSLHKAGIRVISEKEKFETPGAPTLFLQLIVSKSATAYTFLIEVQLREDVTLARRPSLNVPAATWQNNAIGIFDSVNRSVADQVLREGVAGVVNLFIKDYLAANKKTKQ